MPEIVKGNPTNEPGSKPVKSHSKFNPNYSRYDTHRFGLNTPHFVMAGVTGDNISMRCTADVDTFNLKAPMMQPVKRNMDYFQVTMRALLPNCADYIITNPRQGDDVIAKNTNAIWDAEKLKLFLSKMVGTTSYGDYLNKTFTPSGTPGADMGFMTAIDMIIRWYQQGKNLLSKAALPKFLGYDFDELVKFTNRLTDGSYAYDDELDWDSFFEKLFTIVSFIIDQTGSNRRLHLRACTLTLSDGSGSSIGSASIGYGSSIYIVPNGDPRLKYNKQFMTFCDFIRFLDETNDYWMLQADDVIYDSAILAIAPTGIWTPASGDSSFKMVQHLLAWYYDEFENVVYDLTSSSQVITVASVAKDQNILRCGAYQLACAEFYTNDKVDNIYTAQLYLQNLWEIANLANATLDRYFLLNGISMRYDALSGHVLTDISNAGSTWFTISSAFSSCSVNQFAAWAYIHNVFGLCRSLKYEDYFVGARKYPLAVGDVSVGVDTGTNTVDIVDVTKKIQVQRFLNQVNRIGRKFSEYIRGIFGDTPVKDMHEPIFLGHVVDTFGAEETDNTGEGQLTLANSTTSKLRNNSSRYGFEVHVGEPSILIGITNYDIVRVYRDYTDKENLHVDRFDMFNPFMQFVGDQAVEGAERSIVSTQVFGYVMRYMEYKQKVDQCAGGFAAEQLPGYAAILKGEDVPYQINSDFIRSHVNELDQFYSVLNGFTPSRVWNFIVRTDNEVTAHRPMSFNPQIL